MDTIFGIRVRFGSEGARETQRTFASMGREGDRATKSAIGLRSIMAGAAAWGGLRLAKSALIDFNGQVEQSKVSLQTMFASNGISASFAAAQPVADKFFATMQQAAKDSVGTTSDFIAMAQGIAPSLLGAGKSMKDLEQFTIGAMTAASAFGIRGDMMALDVQQALQKGIEAKDRIQMLLPSIGMKRGDFNKLDQEGRFGALNKMLSSQVLKDAAKAQGETLPGQISTLKDSLSQTFGKIGLPLVRAMTAEVKKWNTWIDANGAKVEAWGKTFAGYMIKGAGVLKSAFGFIVDNKEVFLAIGAGFLALKAGGGLLSGGGLNELGVALGLATTAAVGFYTAYQSIANNLDDLKGWLNGDSFDPSMPNSNKEHNAFKDAKLWATMTGKNEHDANLAGFAAQEKVYRVTRLPRLAVQSALDTVASYAWGSRFGSMFHKKDDTKGKGDKKPDDKLGTPGRSKAVIYIAKIEAITDDPAQLVFALTSAAEKAITNPVAARAALMGM
jgi:hypothetical protein